MVHRGHRARVKARYLSEGLEGFAEHEVLELLLFYALPQGDVNPLAHRLIKTFGTLGAVLDADIQQLQEVEGVGEHAALLLHMLPHIFRYYHQNRYQKRQAFPNAGEAIEYCAGLFHGLHTEHLYMLCLNAKHELIRTALLHEGTIDRVSIYAREVARLAIHANAHAVILCHNHPGGMLAHSEQDVHATLEILQTLHPLGIDVLDHIIVADGKGLSLCRERGLASLALLQRNPLQAADSSRHARARVTRVREEGEEEYGGDGGHVGPGGALPHTPQGE